MNQNYLTKTIRTYINSFRDIKLLSNIFLLDGLFFLSIFLSFNLALAIIKSPLSKLKLINLEDIMAKPVAEVQVIALTLKNFILLLIMALLLLFLLAIISFSLFEGAAWCRILKKKLTLNYLVKFFFLNLIWFVLFIILFSILLIGLKTGIRNIALLIISTLFLYLIIISSFLFTKENKLKEIKKALKIAVIKIHYFIIPIILIVITAFVLEKLNILYKSLSVSIISIINLILFALLFSWVKIYLAELIQKV